jgi:radical SAM protein with 4Fe4S-binding SPASM domain
MTDGLTRIFHTPPFAHLIDILPPGVVLYGADGAALTQALRYCSRKVIGVDFMGPLSEIPPAEILGSVDVVLYTEGEKELIKNFHHLPRRKVLCRIPSGSGLFDSIKLVASLNIVPDLLQNLEEISAEQALDVVRYYLHHRALQVPIEPFHSILSRLVLSQNLDLWEMARYNPDHFVFLDAEGNVGLSYEDLADKRFLGNIHQDPVSWKKSEVYKDLSRYLDELPQTHPECLACPFFFFCRGYMRYKRAECSTLTAVLEELHQASVEINELRELFADAGQLPSRLEVEEGSLSRTANPQNRDIRDEPV